VKILVLNYEYPPVGGGGGRACAELCCALAGRGHEIRVITSHAKGLPFREEIDGYDVLRVLTGRRTYFRASFLSMAAYILAAFLPALFQLKGWKPEVMHVHFAVPTGVMAPLLSRLSGVPYVLTAHLGDVPGGVAKKTDRWFRIVFPFTPGIWKNASSVAAVSSFTKDLALKHYPVPIQVIPNGVPLPTSKRALQVLDPPRILFAGRFQPQKNLLFLIDALHRIRDLPWKCVLMGDGPLKVDMEERIRALQLSERITMPGWVRPEKVWEALGESDLLAMPSLTEGLPVIGIHALVQGVAIVANRTGGLVDLVEDAENGRLCEVGDAECFERSLRWCLQDRRRLLQLKSASQDRARKFDIQRVADAYEEIFSKVSRG
jgi:glycosyltransferase involved in cell wall biosynthesis